MNKKEISIVISVMCMLLTIGIFVQIKTIKNTQTVISQTIEDNGLRDEVLQAKEKYERLYEKYEKQQLEIKEIREKAIENDEALTKLDDKVEKNHKILGNSEVQGKGIEIILADSSGDGLESLVGTNDLSAYVIHYGDLLQVINALKNAGAEAVSINGQRVVSTTAIVCIGNVISVNGEKVANPFTINAIGDTERLYGAMTMLGGYIDILNKYGLVKSISKKDEVMMPKYTGTYTTEYMEVV